MEQYGQALMAREQVVRKLHMAQQELEAAYSEMRLKFAAGCTASEALQANEFQKVLVKNRDIASEALGAAERRVNVMLKAMLTARQQREITDKFHDKQKQSHQRVELVEEQKMLDDLAGRRGSSMLSWSAAGNQTL